MDFSWASGRRRVFCPQSRSVACPRLVMYKEPVGIGRPSRATLGSRVAPTFLASSRGKGNGLMGLLGESPRHLLLMPVAGAAAPGLPGLRSSRQQRTWFQEPCAVQVQGEDQAFQLLPCALR